MSLRVGVVGMGFMGRAHAAGYVRAGATLVAYADPSPPGAVEGNLSQGGGGEDVARALHAAQRHAHARDLFARGDIDAVSICTPTDTHVGLACDALAAGLDVVVEKPIATRSSCVRDLIERARDSPSRVVIPAMVMRTWPGWDWLKARLADGSLGRLRALTLTRLGSPPPWSREFYADPARSGGALFDLHVHDADFVSYLLGPPERVLARGRRDHLLAVYAYPERDLHVAAEGGWLAASDFPFRMRFTAEFEGARAGEGAVADWDLARAPSLLLTRAGQTRPVELSTANPYDLEIASFVARLRANRHTAPRAGVSDAAPVPTLDEALLVTEVLEAEARSLDSGEWEVP